MPLIGALVVKEFQTWLRGRLTFAAFTLLVLLVSLLVFLLGTLILAPDANAAPALLSPPSPTPPHPAGRQPGDLPIRRRWPVRHLGCRGRRPGRRRLGVRRRARARHPRPAPAAGPRPCAGPPRP